MATVLRVKRRRDNEPLDALVIAGKRRKIEAGESDEATGVKPLAAVVKFAGTLNNHADDVVEHINRTLNKEELKSHYKQRVVDVTNKARATAKEESRENRYKVVNYKRCIESANSEDKDDSFLTVIDVEDSVSPAVPHDKEIGYVYDVYYTQTEADMHLEDDDLSILPFEQELVYDTFRENGIRPEDDCESEDSNSESNWKNDYPDSDHSANSVRDEDMQAAVRVLKLEDESSDLSSEEDFVYAVDEGDVEAYGYNYAKYKARVKDELGDEESSHSDDDDFCGSDAGSKEDDD